MRQDDENADDHLPIDPATLLPDQRALWDATRMDAPLPPRITLRMRDLMFRFACELACTPLADR